MPDDRIPMTKEGYEKKKTELDRMMNIEMIEVAKRIATAREMGDLSENAEYHAAREDQDAASPHRFAEGFLEPGDDHRQEHAADRCRRLRGPRQGKGSRRLGPRDFPARRPGARKITPRTRFSPTAPSVKGLLSKKIGDVVNIAVPMGTIRYEVLEITFGE